MKKIKLEIEIGGRIITIGKAKSGFHISFFGLTIYIGNYEFTLFQLSKKATAKQMKQISNLVKSGEKNLKIGDEVLVNNGIVTFVGEVIALRGDGYMDVRYPGLEGTDKEFGVVNRRYVKKFIPER